MLIKDSVAVVTDGTGTIKPKAGTFDIPAVTNSAPVSPGVLRWDPNVAPAAPAGYIGHPGVLHTVVGSQVLDLSGEPTGEPRWSDMLSNASFAALFTVAGQILQGLKNAGKTIFTSNCGGCHTLAAAGTSGTPERRSPSTIAAGSLNGRSASSADFRCVIHTAPSIVPMQPLGCTRASPTAPIRPPLASKRRMPSRCAPRPLRTSSPRHGAVQSVR